MAHHRLPACLVSMVFLLSIVAPSVSNAQNTMNPVEILKACVIEHLPAERAKSSPSFNSVKNSCAQEYDALLAVVHPKVANEYKKLIRNDIDKELKKKN